MAIIICDFWKCFCLLFASFFCNFLLKLSQERMNQSEHSAESMGVTDLIGAVTSFKFGQVA